MHPSSTAWGDGQGGCAAAAAAATTDHDSDRHTAEAMPHRHSCSAAPCSHHHRSQKTSTRRPRSLAISPSSSSSSPVPSSPTLTCTSSSSRSSRHYSPISTPYPVVYSTPSLIDTVRSVSHSHSLPRSGGTSPRLHSSLPPSPFYSLPLSLGTGSLDQEEQQHHHYSAAAIAGIIAAGASPYVHAPQLHSHSTSHFPPLYSLTNLSLSLAPDHHNTNNNHIHHPYSHSNSDSNNNIINSIDYHTILHTSTAMSTYPPPPLALVPHTTPDLSSNTLQQSRGQLTGASVLSPSRSLSPNFPGTMATSTTTTTTTTTTTGDAPLSLSPSSSLTATGVAPHVSRPRSVIDMAIDTANGNAAGRTVRRNVITRWEAIPRNARIYLTFTGIMTVVKIVATIVVLVIDRDASCPFLKVLLILYAIRSAIGFPFAIYATLHPRIQGAPLTTRDILLERQRTMMEIAGTCLFFLSNYFLFAQANCRLEAPGLYYMTVVHVILGYIVILIPIVLCMAVILCLPLVLRIMRALDLGPTIGVKGATEEMIAAIPIVKYRKPVPVAGEAEAENTSRSTVVNMGSSGDRIEPSATASLPPVHLASATSVGSSATAPQTSSTRSPKRGLFRFLRRAKRLPGSGKGNGEGPSSASEGQGSGAIEYLTLTDPQDAVCAICLCEYEDEEQLRKMNCSHYFHKDCVDEWLKLNRSCPLCKRDIEELAGLREPTTTTATATATTDTGTVGAGVAGGEGTPPSPAPSGSRSPRRT